MEQFNKTFEADFEVNEGSREVVSIISTKSFDLDRDIMFPDGMVAKNGTPILFNHDKKSLPIGKALWFKIQGDKILSKAYISDKTQMARDIFGLIQDDIISGVSVGFKGLEYSRPTAEDIRNKPYLKNARYIFRKWRLNEYSFTPFPCNPECVTLAVAKGYSPETVIALNGGKLPETKDLIKNNCWCWEQPEPTIALPRFSKKW